MYTNGLILKTGYFLLSLHWSLSQYVENQLCYTKCLCVPDDSVISCDRTNDMLGIPTNIDPSFHRLMIQNGRFMEPFIYKKNLTGLNHLTFLKVIYCQIVGVESRAFEDMKRLKYLDLSHNNIRIIQPFTFIGLNLAELHLMENYGLFLDSDSFKGMIAESINLRSNGLKSIDIDTFNRIRFQRLNLYNNSISVIDPEFAVIFKEPDMFIDLTGNPLDCKCEMKWLLGFLKSKFQNPKLSNHMKNINFTCAKPTQLIGKEIIQMTDRYFQCIGPRIKSLFISFGVPLSQLTCVAIGNSYRAPGVSWKYVESENFKELRRNPITKSVKSQEMLSTTLTINVTTPPNTSKAFTCTTWLEDDYNDKIVVNLRLPSQMINADHLALTPKHKKRNKLSDLNVFYQKQFTILEMVAAIIGTFVVTLILMVMIIQSLRWWKKAQQRQIECIDSDVCKQHWTMGHNLSNPYSPSGNHTEYDVLKVYETPAQSIRQSPPFNRIEFLDYKTLNNIYSN